MNQFTDTKPWHRGSLEVLSTSFITAYLVTLLTFGCSIIVSTQDMSFWFGSIMFVTIFAFTWFINQFKRQTFSKQFSVNRGVAWQIIVNILNEKGIPYFYKNDRFELEDSNLVIQLEESLRPGLEHTCRIRIGPISTETLPLLNSLREKIDMAFIPKGL